MTYKFTHLLLLFIAMNSLNSFAQKTISITTKNNVLVLETDKDNSLLSTYIGKKLDNDSPNIQAIQTFR